MRYLQLGEKVPSSYRFREKQTSGAKQVAENGRCDGMYLGMHPSGAKAPSILLALSARLKSCPDSPSTQRSFPASCKARVFGMLVLVLAAGAVQARAASCVMDAELLLSLIHISWLGWEGLWECKPYRFDGLIGTAEAVPFQNFGAAEFFRSIEIRALTQPRLEGVFPKYRGPCTDTVQYVLRFSQFKMGGVLCLSTDV